jgi:hypothetical protein
MQWMLSSFITIDEVIVVGVENSIPLFGMVGLKKLNIQK